MTSVTRLFSLPGTNILMRVGRELTSEENTSYRRDLSYVTEYDHTLDLQPIVAANGAEALRTIDEVESRTYHAMLSPSARREATQEVNRTLLNFLTSMRLLLDHSQTRVARHFGKDSEMLGSYHKVTSAIHDGSRAYRVLYNLRNYAQHCGMPIREVTVEAHVEQGQKVRRVAVECDAKSLLDRFSDWRHARQDLAELQPSFPIRPLVEQGLADLNELVARTEALEVAEVRDACSRVFALLREAAGTDPKGAVVEVVTDKAANKTHFVFLVPPERLLRILGFNADMVGRV